MFLREMILSETSNEDRAIVSLATAVTLYLRKHASEFGDNVTDLGKIGELFDTPLAMLNDVNLKLAPDQYLLDLTGSGIDRTIGGVWDGNTESVIINHENINNAKIVRVLSHEFRHALDDYKSDFRAGEDDNRYDTPKKKHYRNVKDDPYMSHLYTLAKPAEINARFAEVLTDLAIGIKKFNGSKEEIRSQALDLLNRSLAHRRIAELFPERTESRDFRRLMSRAADYIDKEIAHIQK